MDLVQRRDSDLVEKAALAQVLHSFYNGIENIFVVIGKNTDGWVPEGSAWHRDLLDRVARKTDTRPALLKPKTREALLEYLGFRHVVRHIYSTNLDSERMKGLAVNVTTTWEFVKQDTLEFLNTISS